MDQNNDGQDVMVLLCTVPNEAVGGTIAKALVEQRSVACVNIVPGVRSIYRWKQQICDDAELLLVMKTVRSRVEDVSKRVAALHPYETPELVAFPVVDGLASYMAWVREEVGERRD